MDRSIWTRRKIHLIFAIFVIQFIDLSVNRKYSILFCLLFFISLSQNDCSTWNFLSGCGPGGVNDSAIHSQGVRYKRAIFRSQFTLTSPRFSPESVIARLWCKKAKRSSSRCHPLTLKRVWGNNRYKLCWRAERFVWSWGRSGCQRRSHGICFSFALFSCLCNFCNLLCGLSKLLSFRCCLDRGLIYYRTHLGEAGSGPNELSLKKVQNFIEVYWWRHHNFSFLDIT